MKNSKITLGIAFVLLAASASAVDLSLASDTDVYSNGDTIKFNVTAEPGNYTVVFPEQDFKKDFSIAGSNSSEKSKIVEHTFQDILFNSNVEASLENYTVETEDFYVGTGVPVFEEVSISPDFVKVDDFVKISARVADADLDVQDAVLRVFHNNSTIVEKTMEKENLSKPYYRFKAGFQVKEKGDKDYSIAVTSNSSNNDYASEFRVYPEGYAGDQTDITAYVGSTCGMEVDPFTPPGGGIITLNGTGSFLIGFERDGGYAVNVSAKLNVTYEGNYSELYDGELGEPMNMSYDKIVTPKPIVSDSNTTMLKYNKTSREGHYRGNLKVNATCYRKAYDKEYFEELGINYTQEDLYERVAASPDGDPYLNYTTNAVFKTASAGNATVPEDANQTGEESNDTVEGDGPQPGQTPNPVPEPVPDPVPEPEPDPVPILSLNIEETESIYSIPKGRYAPIKLQITNKGNKSVPNVNIDPLVGSLGDWQSRSASIGNLSKGESVNRTIFLRPPESMRLGEYRIPVLARSTDKGRDLELHYIDVNVVKDNFSTGIEIAEIPDQVSIQAGSSVEIPLLLNNTGKKKISNVSVEVQNLEECGAASVSTDISMSPNSTASATLKLNASQQLGKCNTTVIVSTEKGAYSFSDFSVNVEPEKGIIPPRFRVPLIAILWTVALMAYAVARRKLEINSFLVKGPFVIMVMGEAFIVLYLAAQYYNVVPPGVLPF